MPAIARRAVLIVLACSALARADALSEIVDLVAGMAAGLANDRPDEFMNGFDRDMPDYGKIRANVTALVAEAEVTSSVQPVKDEGDASRHSIDLDWLLQIKSRAADAGPLVRRQQVVHCELVKEKKRWRIVSLTPVDFFAPAKFSESK